MTSPNRHIPRVCANCGAPLGGNDRACWSCHTVWVAPSAPEPDRLAVVEQEPSPHASEGDLLGLQLAISRSPVVLTLHDDD